MNTKHAEIHYTKEGPAPRVELVVPYGTTVSSTFRVLEVIEKEVISKITPRGCQPCYSGVHFNIRERLENVLTVDLESGKIM